MNFPSAWLVGHCHYKSSPMKSIAERNTHGLQKNRTEVRVSDGKNKNNKRLPWRCRIDNLQMAVHSTTTHILCRKNTFKDVNIHHLFHLHHFLFHSILLIPSLSATWLQESLSLITNVLWMTVTNTRWKDLDFCSSTWNLDKMVPLLWPYREMGVWGETSSWENGKKILWSEHAFAEHIIWALRV